MADLIDRPKLMHCIEKWLPRDKSGEVTREHNMQENLCVSMLIEIQEQPTVDVEPMVHSEWQRCTDHIKGDSVRCVRCGLELSAWYNRDLYGVYCPHCGAKMDGEVIAKNATTTKDGADNAIN